MELNDAPSSTTGPVVSNSSVYTYEELAVRVLYGMSDDVNL